MSFRRVDFDLHFKLDWDKRPAKWRTPSAGFGKMKASQVKS